MRLKSRTSWTAVLKFKTAVFFVVRKERCIMFVLLMYWGSFSKKALQIICIPCPMMSNAVELANSASDAL